MSGVGRAWRGSGRLPRFAPDEDLSDLHAAILALVSDAAVDGMGAHPEAFIDALLLVVDGCYPDAGLDGDMPDSGN